MTNPSFVADRLTIASKPIFYISIQDQNGFRTMNKFVWLPITLATVVGCSPADNSSTPATSAPMASTRAPAPLSQTNSASNAVSSTFKVPTEPKDVVAAFLDSMRVGNAEQLAALLSAQARAEINRQGLEISPIGSPQAKFEIGNVETLSDTTLVESKWIEPSESGTEPSIYEVVWELRKEAAGWRICCMAVDTHTPGEEVQVVNFEQLNDEPAEPTEGNVQRVASLPNTPPAGVPNGQLPVPPNAFPQLPPSNGFGPQSLPPANLPPANLPPAGNGFNSSSALPPASLPPAGLQPANGSSGSNSFGSLPPLSPPSNLPANNLPASLPSRPNVPR